MNTVVFIKRKSLPTILGQFREFLLRHVIMQNPCRQSGDQRPAIGRAPFPAARSSRPLAKATARRLLAPPSHPEMNGHSSGPCDRLVAAAEGPHAQKPHPGPSRRPLLGMEGRGRGRQWRRPAAPAHGREGTNRAAGAPRRGGTEQRTPSRTPSPGGQAMEERGTGEVAWPLPVQRASRRHSTEGRGRGEQPRQRTEGRGGTGMPPRHARRGMQPTAAASSSLGASGGGGPRLLAQAPAWGRSRRRP